MRELKSMEPILKITPKKYGSMLKSDAIRSLAPRACMYPMLCRWFHKSEIKNSSIKFHYFVHCSRPIRPNSGYRIKESGEQQTRICAQKNELK